MHNEKTNNTPSPEAAIQKSGMVKVLVPATIANLVCGFDILGLSLQEPRDMMEMRLSDKPGIRIRHTDNYDLPTDPLKNVAGVALQALINEGKIEVGFDLTIE